MRMAIGAAVVAVLLLCPAKAWAEPETFELVIKDHRFSPAELVVLAHHKVKLVVKNEDPAAEEFESYDLRREKMVAAGGQITLFIGPLAPGRYEYFGDFHKDTAKGVIVAAAAQKGN